MKGAAILAFSAKHLVKPEQKSCYNDDVNIPHYVSAARLYASQQRKGLQEEHLDSLSMVEHLEAALISPFFLSLPTPIPPTLQAAIDFIASGPTASALSFWNDQLSRIEQLANDSLPVDLHWKSLIPAALRPAAGKLRLATLMSLTYQFNLGGSLWLQQFLFGFRLTGTFSQIHTFPLSEKACRKKPIGPSRIAASSAQRFQERAPRSGLKNAQLLWGEALLQVKSEWPAPPFPLSRESAPYTLLYPTLNIAFRFGAQQADKLRACDDLRYAMTNLACSVVTPTKLASWDHLSELCRTVAHAKRDWHFFKADHEAAYKQLPLEWEQSNLAAIALRNPANGRWYGFMSRTLMFGAVSAVLHYNILSRILSELACKIFGIPMLATSKISELYSLPR